MNYTVIGITEDGILCETENPLPSPKLSDEEGIRAWREEHKKRVKFYLPNQGIFRRLTEEKDEHIARVNGQFIEIGYEGEVTLDENKEVINFTIRP